MTRHSLADRVLHRLALQSRAFRKFCFTRECERNDRRLERQREHVFVAGLARSGSTALLNTLHASGAFAATTYELMPFVLAPSLARVVNRLGQAAPGPVQRRHGDALTIDAHSAEALDGIFWNTYLPTNESPLRPRHVARPVLEHYAMFIENTLQHYGRERYLSKMNQGIALLPSLASWFERSLFLVPFRDPLQQAASLLRQHQRFARLDGYEARYLAWLEHREFGATHRPFVADDRAQGPAGSPTHINYWLQQWRDGYSYLAQLADTMPNILPLAYERLGSSSEAWNRLSQRLQVDLAGGSFHDRNDALLKPANADRDLLDECRALYRRLAALGEGRAC